MKIKNKDAGFTLIEILVGVAIIAILTLILIPVGRGALERAKITKCSANLRQIGTAMLAFAGDHNGAFRGVSDGNWPFGNFGPADDARGFGALWREGYVTGSHVFFCPSQTKMPFFASNEAAWDDGAGYSSYACLAGFTAYGDGIVHDTLSEVFSKNLPLNSPSRLLAMDVCANPTETAKDRAFWNHQNGRPQGGNILFGDGSVRWRKFPEMEKRYSRAGFDFYW